MTQNIRVVMKKVDEPAAIVGIESTLETMQSIVEGYIRPLWIGNDGKHRIAIILNEDGALKQLPHNIALPDGTKIVGNVFITKASGAGEWVTMDEAEAEHWRGVLDDMAKPENKMATEIPNMEPPPPDGVLQVVVVPRTQDQLTGDELTPEDIIDRLSVQIGRGCHCVRIDQRPDLYAEALAVMKQQGHEFELVDGHKNLLQFKNDQRWLRLVQWMPETPINSVEELATLLGVDPSAAHVGAELADKLDRFVVTVGDDGVEFAGVGSPYPLDYPFTATELFSLIKALSNDEPVDVVEETIIDPNQ